MLVLFLRRFLLIALCLSVSTARAIDPGAETLAPLALLNRCYFHLTQKRIPLSHPLRAQVQRGTNPIAACLTLLDSTVLKAGGFLASSTEDNRRVLRTLNDFHRTWFPRDDLAATIYLGYLVSRTNEIHDSGEPGLHLSRALFGEGARFDDIVTGRYGMEALRTGGAVTNISREAAERFVGTSEINNRDNLSAINTQLVQKGELIGIRSLAGNPAKQNSLAFAAYNGLPPNPIRIHQSAGGGIIGTRTFLLSTLGLGVNIAMNGGLRMSRDFSKTVLKSFLCRDIPVIRTVDAAPYVQSEGKDVPPFRTNASCMSCHATLDPLAAVARNHMVTHLPFFRELADQKNGLNSGQIFEFAPDQPRESGMLNADSAFHRRPPFGSLYFRNYKGELRNEQFEGIPELGNTLADSEDLYVCAASRYLQYFTGVQVSLHDPGDANFPPPSDSEREYKEFVVKLGLELKSHQSLKTLIKRILESPLYQSAAMRNYGEIRDGQSE